MKSLVVFSCVILFAQALDKALVDELKEKIQEYGFDCAEQEKPPPSDIEKLMNHEEPATHEGKCTIFCVMKKFNLMKDDTSLGPGYTPWLEKAQTDDPTFYDGMLSVYKICGTQVKSEEDGCEKAYLLAKCSKEEGLKLGLDKAMGE